MESVYQKENELRMIELLNLKNKQAFIDFYEYYAPALYGTILLKANNNYNAGLALQNTFREIWQIRNVSPTYRKFFLWMHTIALRNAIEANVV